MSLAFKGLREIFVTLLLTTLENFNLKISPLYHTQSNAFNFKSTLTIKRLVNIVEDRY